MTYDHHNDENISVAGVRHDKSLTERKVVETHTRVNSDCIKETFSFNHSR